MFHNGYLCVRVQGEQPQSGLTPHPGLDISGTLKRNKVERLSRPLHALSIISKVQHYFSISFNLCFWEIGFVDLKADLTHRWAQLWESGGTTTHFTEACANCEAVSVNSYHQFPCTYGFTIAYQSVLQQHDKLYWGYLKNRYRGFLLQVSSQSEPAFIEYV